MRKLLVSDTHVEVVFDVQLSKLHMCNTNCISDRLYLCVLNV